MSSNVPAGLINMPAFNATRMAPNARQGITKERIKQLLPRKTSIAVTDELITLLDRMEDDTNLSQELLEEDFLTYIPLLSNGNSSNSLIELANAIKYCNLKRNYNNKEAWSIVFPEKFAELTEANKQVDNFVSMYTNSKLVVAIDKEMLIPIHLQYAPYFHAAVKKQFELMNGTSTKDSNDKPMIVSPMVQHLAAKELAVLTRQPEETKIDIKVSPSDAAMGLQGEMNAQLEQIVAFQRKRLEDGEDIIDVQAIGIDFGELGKDDE